jgi:signal transduction histidine kinase
MLPALPTRSPGSRSPHLGENVVAVLIGLIALGSLIARAAHDGQPLIVLLVVPVLASILLRSTRPLVALVLALTVVVAIPDDRTIIWPVALVLYTSASQRSWSLRRLALLALAVILTAIIAWLAWGHTRVGGANGLLAFTIAVTAQVGASIAFGLYIGARRRVVEGLHERAERLDRERELLADRAVAEERVRIAQELHDVVAHNVSLMVVRAQGLGAIVDHEPVKSATDGIADLGREAMTEMHRTLRLLRADGVAAELAPQPGLAMLERLLEQTRAAGLDIELSIEGRPRALSQGVDLSAFRIIQEALTNVIKHAGGARAHVTVLYGPEDLRLTVTDNGHETHRPDDLRESWSEGHGLIGMRERATMFGGTLVATAGADRGFTVSATLPYEERGQ